MSDEILTTDFTDDDRVCLREIRAALDHCRGVFMHVSASVRQQQAADWTRGGTEEDYAKTGEEAHYFESVHAGIIRLIRTIDAKPASMGSRLRKKA